VLARRPVAGMEGIVVIGEAEREGIGDAAGDGDLVGVGGVADLGQAGLVAR
jgi:hypothetical protein